MSKKAQVAQAIVDELRRTGQMSMDRKTVVEVVKEAGIEISNSYLSTCLSHNLRSGYLISVREGHYMEGHRA